MTAILTPPTHESAQTSPAGASPVRIPARWRVGLLGAGYIADWHVKALRLLNNVDLVAICDRVLPRAQGTARLHGIPHVYDSLEKMLAEQKLDAVHVLLPPEAHFAAAAQLLNAGVHVMLEKPMCVDAAQCAELAALAKEKNLRLGTGHNFLFYQTYERLRTDIHDGRLGPLDHVAIHWNLELGQVRAGPHESWLFRDPRNVLLEIGPHLAAILLDLVGTPDKISVQATNPCTLPTGQVFYRRWQIQAWAGRVAVDLFMSFVPGFAERYVHVRGSLASATVDIHRDTYIRHEHTPSADDFDRYGMIRREARSLGHQGYANLRDYILSKFRKGPRGSAYADSIAGTLRAFYTAAAMDKRITPDFGHQVIALCQQIGKEAPIPTSKVVPTPAALAAKNIHPKILVLGSTGFIGKELVRQLTAAGHPVRILTRSLRSVPAGLDPALVEVFPGDLNNPADISRAIAGMDCVYHLARAHVKRWDDYQRFEIEVTCNIAEACLTHGVRRFIYTGTIDSYYAGARAGTINDDTPLDSKIKRRNLYARAKAASETVLLELHQSKKLPLIIMRPGIVIGAGGSPMHWGVGMWKHDSVCHLWGKGQNKLPLVLVEDVASALVAGLDAPGIEGHVFNLVADPVLTAGEYLDELEAAGKLKLQRIPTSPFRYYLSDMFKWCVKVAVRHHDRRMPSYRDWESRTQKALWDCSASKKLLHWKPTSDRAGIIEKGIRVPLDEILR